MRVCVCVCVSVSVCVCVWRQRRGRTSTEKSIQLYLSRKLDPNDRIVGIMDWREDWECCTWFGKAPQTQGGSPGRNPPREVKNKSRWSTEKSIGVCLPRKLDPNDRIVGLMDWCEE